MECFNIIGMRAESVLKKRSGQRGMVLELSKVFCFAAPSLELPIYRSILGLPVRYG